MNSLAIATIQKHGGFVLLLPIQMDLMCKLLKGVPKNLILDQSLKEATGLNCIVGISKKGSEDARKELGL